MKILVTGGSGLVGKALLRNATLKRQEILAPTHAELDLKNFSTTEKFLADEKPDLIVHCAGRVGGILANQSHMAEFLIDNLEIGKNLVQAAANVGIKRLINLSSSCVYPKDRSEALQEKDVLTGPLEPTNEGYAIAKIATMKLCEYFSKNNPELEYKSLIPCNLYGPYDKFDEKSSHLLPAIIQKIHIAKKNKAASVEIWGDGKARREFMYVDDLADFIAFAAKNFSELPALMNVGVGHDHTIDEYYQTTARVLGYEGGFTHNTSMPSGMQRKLVSVEKQHAYGWIPRTSLELGIEKTYEYFLAIEGVRRD